MGNGIVALLIAYSQIAANIAQVIVLVALALALLVSRKQARLAMQSLSLMANANQFQAFKAIIDESRSLKPVRDSLEASGIPSFAFLKTKYHTLAHIKASEEISPLFHIGGFYEQVGVLVRRGFVDFDLVFDMMPLPDKLWSDSQSIVQAMRTEWVGDFWSNWEYLYIRYAEERIRQNKLHNRPSND